MKVYIDTEFYEHGNRNYALGTIELISIGAVREDGASFYAENTKFAWGNVPSDHWLWENVKPHLWHGSGKPLWLATADVKGIPKGGPYSPSRMAEKFFEFATAGGRPEFWGYFCDYDWVAICSLYGRMVDLPSEFPMYCLDVKQEMHRLGVSRYEVEKSMPRISGPEHHALTDARWISEAHHVVRNLLPA